MNWPFKLAPIAVLIAVSSAAGVQSPPNGLQEKATQASPADVASAVAQICPDTIIHGPDGAITGCRTCPPGTAFHGFFKQGKWGLDRATIGHFVSASSTSILIGGDGCDPHSENFGGTYVLELQRGSPKLLRYNAGLLTTPCRQLQLGDGRDFLVCQGEWGAQGYVSRYVDWVVFGPDGKSRLTSLFMTHDTVRMCGETVEGKPDGPTQQSQIVSVEFPDLNGDGRPDLSITATLGTRTLSASERKNCTEPSYTYVPPEIPAKTYRINYLFDGSSFQPTSSARQTLHLFDKLPPPK